MERAAAPMVKNHSTSLYLHSVYTLVSDLTIYSSYEEEVSPSLLFL